MARNNNYVVPGNKPGNDGDVRIINSIRANCAIIDHRPRIEIANAMGAVANMIDGIETPDIYGRTEIDESLRLARYNLRNKASSIQGIVNRQRAENQSNMISSAFYEWNNINNQAWPVQPQRTLPRQQKSQKKSNTAKQRAEVSILDRYKSETISDLPLFAATSTLPVGNCGLSDDDKKLLNNISEKINSRIDALQERIVKIGKAVDEIYDIVKMIRLEEKVKEEPVELEEEQTIMTFEDESEDNNSGEGI